MSPIFYLETAGGLVLDILVFHETFSTLSIIGLVLVLGMFGFIIVSAYRDENTEKDKIAKVKAISNDMEQELHEEFKYEEQELKQ